MDVRIYSLVGLAALFLFASAANAQDPGTLKQNPETGHYYQVFGQDIYTWDQARAFVLTLGDLDENGNPVASGMGVAPHLATITSSREDDFVDSLRDDSLTGTGVLDVLNQSQVWVGGFQTGTSEPGGGWQWVNAEGVFPGTNTGLQFANWNSAEPNDAGGEHHLAMGRYGFGGGWNDELQTRTSIGGFIVEWDVPLVAEDCLASEGGCTTVIGQVLAFPDGSNPNNATISFNSFEFNDSPGRCGANSPLILFAENPAMENLVIPGYLCGSPKFVVVAVDSDELVIETGTVSVSNDTAIVLSGNVYPDGGVSVCEDPITQVPYSDGDPQYQDVVVWQTTDADDMLEDEVGPGVGGTGQFDGAAGEFTDQCGSSRARVKGASYYVIGMRIDFGPGYTWAGNSAGNLGKFVELTRYKLKLLQQSVKDARSDGALFRKYEYWIMKRLVRYAIRQLDRGHYAAALHLVHYFVKFVDRAHYANVPGENYNGAHLMRGSNIEFMLRVKVVPFAP